MAIDKSIFMPTLQPLPPGIEVEDDEPLEVVLEEINEEIGDGVEEDGEGGVIVTLGSYGKNSEEFDTNLAEEIDEDILTSLSTDLLAEYESDEMSRKDWLATYVAGLELLGIQYEERTTPWKGACGVQHPLLMESAVKFSSETMMETFPAAGPVRAKIIGKETDDKKEAALRVEQDMNYQLTEEMKEYRPEHERLLLNLCLSGNGFKKIYFDPSLGRQVAIFVAAEDIVVPYGASSIDSAERVTHRMRKTKNEILKLQAEKFYREIELGEPVQTLDEIEKAKADQQGYRSVVDKRFQILEIHANVDLEGESSKYRNKDGIALPYVISIEKSTGKVLAIRRNWMEDDDLKQKRQHFVHYGYIPGFGFYYFGLIHLIGGHTKAATSLLRQLVDAGTLSNLSGGFKARGMRVKGDNEPIGPGEWVDVDLPSGAIRDNILPLPYKEPSQTLLALMDRIIEDGRRFAAVADLKISDMSSQAPVGTTLAILERTLKVMSAVQARIHHAMKQEFKLLKTIIRDNTPDSYNYEPEVGQRMARGEDYDMVDVIPVSDPNSSTMSQRVVQYQAVMELSKTAPQLYDLPMLHRQMIETLGVKNAKKLVPSAEDLQPVDPVSENMAIMMGKPVKAFMYQDHEAHLQVHMAAMQDPKIAQIMGQNPQAQLIQGTAMAHVMEHVAFQYRREIEKMLGAALPPMPEQAEGDEEAEHILPPEIEVQLSQLAAMAASKLLQKDIAEAQMMQQQAMANDPVMQLQMRDIAVKEAEVQRKQQKDQADVMLKKAEMERKSKKDVIDAAAKADQQTLNEKEAAARQQLEMLRMLVQASKDQDQLTQQQQSDLMRLAVDIAKAEDTNQLQERQTDKKIGADMEKHGATLAEKAEDRAARRESEKAKTKAKTPAKKKGD